MRFCGTAAPKRDRKDMFFIHLLIFRPSDLEVVEPGFRDGHQVGVSAPRAQPPGRLIWTRQSQLLSRLPSSRLGDLLTIWGLFSFGSTPRFVVILYAGEVSFWGLLGRHDVRHYITSDISAFCDASFAQAEAGEGILDGGVDAGKF